jgi:hypothetical protein
MTSEGDLWYVAEFLVTVRHYRLLTRAQERDLSIVDARTFAAGKVGRQEY